MPGQLHLNVCGRLHYTSDVIGFLHCESTNVYTSVMTCLHFLLLSDPPSISSQDGDTALIIASSNGRSSVVEMLLKAGATINTTNEVK